MKMSLREMTGFLDGKCLPGDMLVNETSAEYLIRKFSVLQQQLADSQREFRSADITIENLKAQSIPEGWKLVPETMHLDASDIESICSQCGNGDKKYGEFNDGIFWIGELSNDGVIKYGLNVADANYPEEGSITVFEFDAPDSQGDAQ